MGLIWQKVKLHVPEVDVKCSIVSGVPCEVNRHALHAEVGGADISEKWRVANILVVEFKLQRQLINLESCLVVAEFDERRHWVQTRVDELQLCNIKVERQKFDDVKMSMLDRVEGGTFRQCH